jgi:hypothetical protein
VINFVAVSPDRNRLIIQWDYDEFTTVRGCEMGENPYSLPFVPDDYTTLLDVPEE